MTLTINVQNDRTIAGTTISAHLRAELTAFAAGAAGKVLLAPVLDGTDAYTLSVAPGKPTAASARAVNLGSDTKIDAATTLDGLKEGAESAIFELTNATKATVFAALENGLKDGTKQVRAYGREKADIEAEASWNVYQILSERAGYVPSAWGQTTIDACRGHQTLADFSSFFGDKPHNNTAHNSADALPSRDFYAFNAAYTIGSNEAFFQNQFEGLKVENKTFDLRKLVAKYPNAAQINKLNIKAVTFYWVTLDFIHANKEIVVGWRGGNSKDYDFEPAMKILAGDTGGVMRAAFDKAWATKKGDLLSP